MKRGALFAGMSVSCQPKKTVNRNGETTYTRDGVLHRVNGPARTRSNGAEEWYIDGKLHRDNDLPAYTDADGTKGWYKHGKLHRDNDLPAYIQFDGTKLWYIDGKRHRDNDLPAAIHADGTQSWFINNRWHRDNGPACINPNGRELWFHCNMLHRLSGPARRDLGKEDYFIYDTRYTKEDFDRIVQSLRKVARRWLMWRNPKIVRCWRWINSTQGKIHFFGEKGAGRIADNRKQEQLIIVK